MMRSVVMLIVSAALAGCAPQVPDSAAGTGVGFGSYSEYLRQREASLAGAGPTAMSAPMSAPLTAVTSQPLSADSQAATGSRAQSTAAPLAGSDSARISDEQDFGAVASRETIQSDAERRAAQQAQRVVVEPTAVPQRTGQAGPNIVEFALTTRHNPGQQVYRRSAIRFGSVDRACARYASPDLAQEAFLARGGPERDPLGLDPDGDGFACDWDPRPFRAALQ